MPLEIEPMHIVIAVGLIVAVAFIVMNRKRRAEDQNRKALTDKINGNGEVGDYLGEKTRRSDALADAIESDEPDVPVLSAEQQGLDLRPVQDAGGDELPLQAPAGDAVAGVAEKAAEPQADTVESAAPAGRTYPQIDTGIESVVLLTTRSGYFSNEKLNLTHKMITEGEMKDLVHVDYYNETSRRWSHSPEHNISCSQIYLSILLANRTRCLDEMVSSKFIQLADNVAIELSADAQLPDSEQMIREANNLKKVIASFDIPLTVWLVSESVIDPEVMNEAAIACGFVYTQGHYEKREKGQKSPVMQIFADKATPGKVSLVLDLPLTSPSTNPLGAFFAVANELCCRLGCTMADGQGVAIGSAYACFITSKADELYRSMQVNGIAAGSPRARAVFSAD